ncbi:MAG: aminopeptidase [Sarcina ventriculi]|uniref:Aminopeptidase 2 n=1 Tax=Sarcina ventriculi TaxID=1267 RepID=A0ABM9UR46_SARVE|nr:aminopeptidase [Sarcina ventriculi]MDO4401701.1 aminopeptidase [Clostridiaceae bacterium]MBU5321478.1 aminopeptidase [Sarcina ventriculi]MCI5636999.1 aminopeptidase [Sarcina ventriculi]MDY7062797.1 aminopeptidase [Sarcina ventriculi]CUN99136.1 Aminopeptidase 2 [Sarcina ventriculi]
MNKENLLKKYAKLAIYQGVNVQKNQTLVISSPIECAKFTRMLVEEAYIKGAKEVVVQWNDELTGKLKYKYSPMEVFETVPEWVKESRLSYAKEGACFLSISASDPELLKDVDPKKVATFRKASSIASREFSSRLMSNENAWSIVSIPTVGWAKKVFPNVSEDEAVEKLWDAIFKIVRVDSQDPVKAWEEHKNTLKKNMDFLNSKRFKSLHYTNSLGTDLIIELPEKHLWAGGAEFTQDGTEFIANMPTEEIFSMPKKTGVNGKVVSSMPLNYGGNLINNFSLTFKDGKVVDFSAEEGYETLKNLLDTDEGAKYLGEVALVPYNSPISNSNIIFFNTLYDENASCHLAFGKAYSLCIKDGEKMSEEELLKEGANDSLTHVDFMIGTKDLQITGTTYDNEKFDIFVNGNWAF